MRKILIVDDNQNNRMLLRTFLEDYAEENDEMLDIHEAVNGLEAALIAESEHFHLIFMDIMMPEMDGIEATRRIRSCDPKTMIIAVSAVDDGNHQRQILDNGAEDYISKPINADIFTARLGNYFSLIHSRQAAKHHSSRALNLFTQEVYSRQFTFMVANEDELSEFWEYYLLDSEVHSEELSDAIRTAYALASVCLKFRSNLQIVVEESVDTMYVTLSGIEGVDPKIIKLIMVKNPTVTDYKSDESRFTIRLPRPVKSSDSVKTIPQQITKPIVNEAAALSDNPPSTPYSASQEVIQVFNYMDYEDLEELKGHIGALDSLLLVVGGDIERDEVFEIVDHMDKISRIATIYTQSYPIAQALAALSRAISAHVDLFIEKGRDLAPMCAAFSRDLSSWLRLIFMEGASRVDYMDDTIIANAQTITGILTMDDHDESEVANLDDIFDF